MWFTIVSAGFMIQQPHIRLQVGQPTLRFLTMNEAAMDRRTALGVASGVVIAGSSTPAATAVGGNTCTIRVAVSDTDMQDVVIELI